MSTATSYSIANQLRVIKLLTVPIKLFAAIRLKFVFQPEINPQVTQIRPNSREREHFEEGHVQGNPKRLTNFHETLGDRSV